MYSDFCEVPFSVLILMVVMPLGVGREYVAFVL